MDEYPEDLLENIKDHTFIYGADYILFDPMSNDGIQKCKSENTTGLCCVWLPRPFDDIVNESLARCDQIGIPTIWQGLPEEPTVYIEPMDKILDIALFDVFYELLHEPQVKAKYTAKELRRVMKQMTIFKNNYDDGMTQLDLDTGDLVKLNPNIVPFATSYPIGRVRKIYKRKCHLNVDIIHIQISSGKCIPVQNSAGLINKSGIERILCKSHDINAQYAAYTKEMLLKSRERGKTLKKERKNRFYCVLREYMGSKIKAELTERNFVKNGKNGKPILVIQEAMKEDVNDILIPLLDKKRLKYKNNTIDLKIKIEKPEQLAMIIGAKNIMNEKNGYEYFLKYPMEIRYGYKLRYAAFRVTFDIGKANKSGNLER